MIWLAKEEGAARARSSIAAGHDLRLRGRNHGDSDPAGRGRSEPRRRAAIAHAQLEPSTTAYECAQLRRLELAIRSDQWQALFDAIDVNVHVTRPLAAQRRQRELVDGCQEVAEAIGVEHAALEHIAPS